MRKKIIAWGVLSVLFTWLASMSIEAGSVVSMAMQTSVTNIAASTTNSTAGPVFYVYNPLSKVRIYLTADGIAATTNGLLTVKFSTASGTESSTNAFDNASVSNIKLTATNIAANTSYTVSDWFELSGVRYLRVGQIENTQLGIVSNIAIRLSYESGSDGK